MGKIRVKSLGDDELEMQQAAESKAKNAAKKAASNAVDTSESKEETLSTSNVTEAETMVNKPLKKKEKFVSAQGKYRSTSYKAKAELVDINKLYTLNEAAALLPKLQRAKFDETVELHFATTETGISGSVTLPHGTGKITRVAIANGSDQTALEELIKTIESGKIEFDILIATPDAMPKLAKVARVLGPKGLMPNPKTGTVSPKPEEVAKKYEGGQINFKTEAKFPLLHVAIGKVSFGEDKIKENATSVLSNLNKKLLKNAILKSTMSPAIRLDVSSL